MNSIIFGAVAVAHIISIALVFEEIDSSPLYLFLLIMCIVEFALIMFVMWLKIQHDIQILPKTVIVFSWVVDVLFWLQLITILCHKTNLLEWLSHIKIDRQLSLFFFVISFLILHMFIKYFHLTHRIRKTKEGEDPTEYVPKLQSPAQDIQMEVIIDRYEDKIEHGTKVEYEQLPQHESLVSDIRMNVETPNTSVQQNINGSGIVLSQPFENTYPTMNFNYHGQ